MVNPLRQLRDLGQSVWFDNIERAMLFDGRLLHMVENDGLAGMTSNPTIFAKAIATDPSYREGLSALLGEDPDADEKTLWVYDEVGTVLMQVPRSSLTQIEYPVVADVDNDGSAELLVVSNPYNGPQTAPSLQVIRDVQDRWVPARRIWNQHTYHVTNVLEDGTIPQVEPKHWTLLNTFRTQAQVAAGGGVCEPEG